MSERITTERLRELIALHRAPFICGRGRPDGCGYCPTCEARRLTLAPLFDDAHLLAADLLAAREIIDGRTSPPTEAEVRAHANAGGRWLISCEGDAGRRHVYTLDRGWEDALGEVRRPGAGVTRWWSLDAEGAGCPWPVAPAADGARP